MVVHFVVSEQRSAFPLLRCHLRCTDAADHIEYSQIVNGDVIKGALVRVVHLVGVVTPPIDFCAGIWCSCTSETDGLCTKCRCMQHTHRQCDRPQHPQKILYFFSHNVTSLFYSNDTIPDCANHTGTNPLFWRRLCFLQQPSLR